MGARYVAVSLSCTIISFVALHWWTNVYLHRLRSEGLILGDATNLENARTILSLLLKSYGFVGLSVNLVVNAVTLLNLCLKTAFFSELYPSETRKLVERLLNYVVYKGTFLPAVIPPTVFQVCLWSLWLTVLCSFKMFQALARDRLERLNASPSSLLWTYSRVYSALVFILVCDIFWIRLCLSIYRNRSSAMLLLLFFEPLSIAFETLQGMLIHGFHLLDIILYNFAGNAKKCQKLKFLERIAHGSLSEWKGVLIRNVGFALDLLTLLMALGHCLLIWWLRGMVFHFADAVLFLNIRALLSAILKRIKGFVKLNAALNSLHAALPDATSEELGSYDDECAICREPMAKAKKLHCNHLFHLTCLRSWLDQTSNEFYSCPTCRKPLFVAVPQPDGQDVSPDEQFARQLSDELNASGPNLRAGMFPSRTLDESPWRSAGLESSWVPPWSRDGAGPSNAPTVRPVGLGRVHMMMRPFEDGGWTHGSGNPVGGLRFRGSADNIGHLLAMSEMVREILPHIPNDMILQDLRRTNSVAVTVNNLLLM